MIQIKKQAASVSRKTLEKISAVILAVVLLCAGTAFATTPSEYVVDIYDGEEITRVQTNKENPYEVLTQAGYVLAEEDTLDLSQFLSNKQGSIVIYRAVPVTLVTIEGETQEFVCSGKVSNLLKKANITVLENQILNVPANTVLTEGLTVKVLDLLTISIMADGEAKELQLAPCTVGEALQKASIALGENDEVTPATTEMIQDQMQIQVGRVTYEERTVTEDLPFEKTTRKDSKMLIGTSELVQEGENGTQDVTYQDKYIDGELVSSEKIDVKVITPAVEQITVKGTMQKSISTSKLKNGGHPISELTPPADLEIVNGAPTSYSKIIRGKAAAYSAKPTAKTASGRRVKPGYIAVNPEQIPYGTEMWIVSTEGYVYGYAIAADTGAFIHQGKFTVDLFMSTNAECRQWGARDVIIYIL